MSSEKTPLLGSGEVRSTAHRKTAVVQPNRLYETQNGFGSHSSHIGKEYRRVPTQSISDQVRPISLSWRNVNVYAIPPNKGCCGRSQSGASPKHILKDVTGVVKPGTLMAVMGASGAGKSTLLNILTARNRGSLVLQGDIRINGMVVDHSAVTSVSAYVQQTDLFIGTLTVREHLTFRALLRMDKRIKKARRMEKVEEVIFELGLTKCADTIIGTPGSIKGISGGEMKRLSFASEFLTNPPLLFCDEATSGLDSFMAQSVVHALQTMVKKGHTIMCTIHQPSSEVYDMFDEVLLLAEGRVAFMGLTSDALKLFESNGYSCPKNYNPADFYILTLAIVPGEENTCKQTVKKICDSFETTDQAKAIEMEIQDLASGKHRSSGSPDGGDFLEKTSYGASYFLQLRTLLWRSWLTCVRDPLIIRVRFMQAMAIGLILGLVYLKTNDNYTQDEVMNINGILFLILLESTMVNLFSVLNVFPVEIPVFLREYNSDLYRTDVYYISKSLVELPVLILLPACFATVLYWMSGLYYNAEVYLFCVAISVLVANIAASFGYIVSAASSTVSVALAIAPPIMIPLVLFGGFFLNNDSIPDYFIWLKYLSWFQYSNELLVINQWEKIGYIGSQYPVLRDYPRKDADMVIYDRWSLNSECPSNSTLTNGTDITERCFRNGNDVINALKFNKDNYYLDIGLLFALLAGFRIISFVTLLIRAKRSS